jgi:hypothetical protein
MTTARPAPEMMLPPLRRLLRPLVRLMIRCGITFPAAADILRALYVEVAAAELGPDRTDSRVSLLTGVHRKEIRRQRDAVDETPPPLVTRNGQLIATWLGAPGYSDASGAPLPLPRTAEDGPSFDRLVESVTRDVRPRAVLDDWVSQGIATIGADDRISLSADAFLPQQGREEQLFYFARNVHDHIAAAAANVLASGPAPFLDRSVHYDRLTPQAAAELERVGREAAQRVLLDINRQAMALGADEVPEGSVARRVNFGIYILSEDERGA